ncbi:MAG: nucleotidyltransferase domain-containing protein [Nanoarchaeota archaeon]|mgnify:CR=1 FL=1
MTGIKINHKNEALLSLAKREMHGRELAKELKTSLTRTQSILNEARKDNILDYRTEGRNHKYFIRKNLAAKAALICAESYKLQKTIAKHPILMPIFQDIIKESNSGLIILFGSYAKGTPKEDSDIDIYIETKDQKTKDNVRKINDLISVKIGEFNPNDLLTIEIIKNHVIIRGGERFLEKTAFPV